MKTKRILRKRQVMSWIVYRFNRESPSMKEQETKRKRSVLVLALP